jgi:hypothetical protein
MSLALGDLDGDGDLDVVAGNNAQTNRLYLNNGTSNPFGGAAGSDITSDTYVNEATTLVDLDNDGDLDVVVANHSAKNRFYLNNGTSDPFNGVSGKDLGDDVVTYANFSLTAGDVDNDGDMDVLVTNNNGPARLLINHVGERRHWLGLRLAAPERRREARGSTARDMLGARAAVFRKAGPVLWRRARADGSYASANDPRVLVGLGDAPAVSRVRVVWPSGRVEEWADPPIDRWMTLQEGTGQAR